MFILKCIIADSPQKSLSKLILDQQSIILCSKANGKKGFYREHVNFIQIPYINYDFNI